MSEDFNKQKRKKEKAVYQIVHVRAEYSIQRKTVFNQGTELNRQEWDTPDGWEDPKWCALMLEQIRKIVLINSLNTHIPISLMEAISRFPGYSFQIKVRGNRGCLTLDSAMTGIL